MEAIFAVGIIVAAVILVVLAHLGVRRMRELAEGVDALVKRLEQLEAKRLTHRTCAGIEDAIAVLVDESRYIDGAELELQAARSRMSKANEILKILREGPQAYDPDRAAGRRDREHQTISGIK